VLFNANVAGYEDLKLNVWLIFKFCIFIPLNYGQQKTEAQKTPNWNCEWAKHVRREGKKYTSSLRRFVSKILSEESYCFAGTNIILRLYVRGATFR